MKILRYLNPVARYLQPLRVFFWALLAGSIVGFTSVMLEVFALSDAYAMLFLVLCLWSLSLLVVVTCFPRQPAEILSGDGLLTRIQKHLQRGFTWIVAVVTVLVNIAVILTTFRLGGIFVNGFMN